MTNARRRYPSELIELVPDEPARKRLNGRIAILLFNDFDDGDGFGILEPGRSARAKSCLSTPVDIAAPFLNACRHLFKTDVDRRPDRFGLHPEVSSPANTIPPPDPTFTLQEHAA